MDISYNLNNEKFNFRVALIISNNNRILLEKSIKNDYWSLVGGRVKLGETTIQAIIRETQEELEIEIDEKELKLNSITENFFTYNNINFHELLFIYQIELRDNEIVNQQDFECKDKDNITHHWFNIEEIKTLNVKPNELRTFLNNQNDLKHYVIINDKII